MGTDMADTQIAPVLPDERSLPRWEVETQDLSNYVQEIFSSFKTARLPFEELWEECWYNYLGQYQPSKAWRKKTEGTRGRSRIFIKLTTLKCHTAHAKLIDIFAGKGTVPFDATPANAEELGIPIDEAKKIVAKKVDAIREHFKKIELEEKLDTAALEMCILGSAVLKGPIVETRRVPRVRKRQLYGMPVDQIDAEVTPYEVYHEYETYPTFDHVPLWEYYVDPNARTTADSIGEIHFQRLLPAQFRRLAYQGGYNKEAVMEAARRATATDADDKTYIQLADNYMGSQGTKDLRVSALEYQGLVPVHLLTAAGVRVPEDVDPEDSIEAIVALGADGIVLKAALNPLGRRQFLLCPYKKQPNSIYGMGVAGAMRDSQKMINSGARLYIDNKALSGSGMTAVNIDRINTKRTQNMEVYPGKVWYIQGNFAPKDAIDSINFTDVTMGLRELIEMFERFADEETGIPKYTQGMQDSFLNKTATGMSMLMTQANINLKTVLKNIDDYWIEPAVEATDEWFTAFGGGHALPMKIKATGADSIIAKEIKMENYMKFLSLTGANPQDAIFMDRVKLMKAIARLLETEDVMRADEEISQIMQEMSARGSAPPDWRETVSIDKLYLLLSRSEQVQILEGLGIQPDRSYPALPTDGGSTSLSPAQERGTGGGAQDRPPVFNSATAGAAA